MERAFVDVRYQPGDAPAFCYRSGMEVYEEMLTDGILVGLGHNAAGYLPDISASCPTRLVHQAFWEPSAFHIEINGQSVDYGLSFVDFESEKTELGIHAVLTLDSRSLPVRLRIHTLLDGTQMFSRYIEIENRSDAPMNLSRLAVLSGGLEGGLVSYGRRPVTAGKDVEKYYSLGYYSADGWGCEGEMEWHDLKNEVTSIDCRYGRHKFRHPLLFLRNNVLGRMYFMQIGWSGGCRFTVDYNNRSEFELPTLCFSAEITARKPLRVIAPHETYVSPAVHMGVVLGGLDDAVNEMHDHIRKSVMNLPGRRESHCHVEGVIGPEFDSDTERIKDSMRHMASLGAEVYIMDAGWACPPDKGNEYADYNGINQVNRERYPQGLDEVREYCHELGMKFGLWVEIERVGKESDVYRKHPEWRVKNHYGQRSEDTPDYSNPEVEAWGEAELARLITEHKLDLLRLDGNSMDYDVFHMEGLDGGLECRSFKHTEAIYRIFDRLSKRFPDVIFENCATGGGRTDLGMVKYFNHTWVSDCMVPPKSLMVANGMSMALPPDRIDRLFGGGNGPAYSTLDFQVRSTMLTHMTICTLIPYGAAPTEPQMEFIRHSVDIYKNFIRKFLPVCRVYHHTDDVAATLREGFTALEVASPDHRMGALAAFTMQEAKKDMFVLYPKGIDPELTYRVTLDNLRKSFKMTGGEILQQGVRVRIPASLSSELILWEAAE